MVVGWRLGSIAQKRGLTSRTTSGQIALPRVRRARKRRGVPARPDRQSVDRLADRDVQRRQPAHFRRGVTTRRYPAPHEHMPICPRDLPLSTRHVLCDRAVRRRDEIAEAEADDTGQERRAQPHMDAPPVAARGNERRHVEQKEAEGRREAEEAQRSYARDRWLEQ